MRKIDIVFDLDQTLIDSFYLGRTDEEIEVNLNKLKKQLGGILDNNKVFITKYSVKQNTTSKSSKTLTIKNSVNNRNLDIQKTHKNKSHNNSDSLMTSYAIFIRPYAKNLLTWCFNNANVSVWTAGTSDYAMNIINGLFNPHQQKRLKLILTRDKLNRGFINSVNNKIYHIANNKKVLVKNMNLLFKHPDFTEFKFLPETTVLIDDLNLNYETNKKAGTIKNIIKIAAWNRNNTDDDKLHKLRQWLIVRNKLLNADNK
jgi:hypothetical protein